MVDTLRRWTNQPNAARLADAFRSVLFDSWRTRRSDSKLHRTAPSCRVIPPMGGRQRKFANGQIGRNCADFHLCPGVPDGGVHQRQRRNRMLIACNVVSFREQAKGEFSDGSPFRTCVCLDVRLEATVSGSCPNLDGMVLLRFFSSVADCRIQGSCLSRSRSDPLFPDPDNDREPISVGQFYKP